MNRKRQNAFYMPHVNYKNDENSNHNNFNNYKNNDNTNENNYKNNDDNINSNDNSNSQQKNPYSYFNLGLGLFDSQKSWEKDAEPILKKLHSITCSEDIKLFKDLLLINNSVVPSKIRSEFYYVASGAKREHNNNKNYYENLLNNYPKNFPSKFLNVIEADIERTFPDEKFFLDKTNKNKLKNILIAYSRRNSKIGYVQGFNFIVGKLLMIIKDEEKAFWIFVQIIENILQNEYYNEMFGMMIDCVIISNLLDHKNSDLMKYLSSKNFDISLKNLLFRWLTTLFVQSTPSDIFDIIWDCMFIEGNMTFVKAAFNIIVQLKDILLKKENMEDLNNFLEELDKYNNIINKDKLKKAILLESEFFNSKNLNEIRNHNIEKEINKQLVNYNKNTKKENKEIICDKNWPFCLEEENRNKNEIVQEILILKIQPEINIINNYFNGNVELKKIEMKNNLNKNKNIINIKNENNLEIYKNLLIQRNKHYCENNNKSNKEIKNSIESFDGSSLSDKLGSQYVNSFQNKDFDNFYKNLKDQNEEMVEQKIKEININNNNKNNNNDNKNTNEDD
jgi:hypothetical protein